MFFSELLKMFSVYSFSFQFAAIAFAVTFVLSPPKRTAKGILFYFLKFVGVFLSEFIVTAGSLALSISYVSWLMGINFFLAHVPIIVLYAVFFCKYSVKSRVILSSVLYVTFIDISELAARFSELVLTDAGLSNWIMLVGYVLILAIGVLLYLMNVSKFDDTLFGGWYITSLSTVLLPVVFVYLCTILRNIVGFTEDDSTFNASKIYYVTVLFVSYATIVTNYIVLYNGCRSRKQNANLQSEVQMLKASETMVRLSEQSIVSMRQFRHDIKNQLAYMDILLDEKKYGELGKYFAELKGSVQESLDIVDCGNAVISSIVNMEKSKAKLYDVSISTKINVPANLPFRENDLCSLLSNLMDNAIEGIVRGKAQERIISLELKMMHDYFLICIKNPYGKGNKDGKLAELRTEKRGGNHGIGHVIVEKIVSKYGGMVKYLVDDENFIVEAMLDITKGEKQC